MSKTVYSSGRYAAGLKRRRESEWTLFQTGYYTELGQWEASEPKGKSASNLLDAADRVAKYLEENNYTYSSTNSTNYTFPIQNSSLRTLSCSSYVQQCLLEAGYESARGGEKMWARMDTNSALNDMKNNLQLNIELVKDVYQLQPGDILQFGNDYHVVIVYSLTNGGVVTKGVPEVLNGYNGFDGKIRTFEELKSKKCYGIRILD